MQTQAAEPTVNQIELDFFTQAPLGTDAIAVANNEHADHQFRINRRSTSAAVEASEVIAQIAQIQEAVD